MNQYREPILKRKNGQMTMKPYVSKSSGHLVVRNRLRCSVCNYWLYDAAVVAPYPYYVVALRAFHFDENLFLGDFRNVTSPLTTTWTFKWF